MAQTAWPCMDDVTVGLAPRQTGPLCGKVSHSRLTLE